MRFDKEIGEIRTHRGNIHVGFVFVQPETPPVKAYRDLFCPGDGAVVVGGGGGGGTTGRRGQQLLQIATSLCDTQRDTIRTQRDHVTTAHVGIDVGSMEGRSGSAKPTSSTSTTTTTRTSMLLLLLLLLQTHQETVTEDKEML